MPNISLPTGKVIYLSVYEYYFQLDEDSVQEFYQSCVADDLGAFVDDPFSQRMVPGRLEVDNESDKEEPSEEATYPE